jgi:GT2 family glycosyltransferase
MAGSLVTVVVIPRERFSLTKRSLESLYANTHSEFTLLYVDGGSPSSIKRYLAEESRKRGFRLVRTNHYMSPNMARNLALRYVDSKYVVFIDNDVLVEPGWLDALVQCAEATGAWVVGPVYLQGDPKFQIIHMAGGIAHIEVEQGKRFLVEKHTFGGQRLADVSIHLQRAPIELIEFHCALVRRDVFDRLGPLDEKLLSVLEHDDLCLTVREAGGLVYYEPSAVVSYIPPPPFAWSDYLYYMLRWSDAWTESTTRHFLTKWNLDKDDSRNLGYTDWVRRHRYICFPGAKWRYARAIEKRLNRLLVHWMRSDRRALTETL